MAIKSIFIVFLVSLLFSCGSSKEKNFNSEVRSNSDSITLLLGKEMKITDDQTNDTILIKRKTIQRTFEGEIIDITLDGNYKWYSVMNKDKLLFIEEVEPGIVHYKKTHNCIHFDGERDSIQKLMIVPDRFEFFDSDYKLIHEFHIENNNPFLQNIPSDITIRKQYADAEMTGFIPKSKQTGKEIVNEHHLWTTIAFQDGFSKILYGKDMVAEGWIIDNATYMIVLDSLGNMVFEHKYLGLTSFPVVSRDGKYAIFSIMPVETTSNAGIKSQTEGFEIWNTEKNKQIYSERNDDPNMWVSEPIINPDEEYLNIAYSFPNSKDISGKVYAFNYMTNILYWRIVTSEDRKRLKFGRDYKTFSDLLKLEKYNHEKLESE